MTPVDLASLEYFLRRHAPGCPEYTAPTGKRMEGITLTWKGKHDAPLASLTVRPQSGRVVIWWQQVETDSLDRADRVAGFLERLVEFAREADGFLRGMRAGEITFSTTEARR